MTKYLSIQLFLIFFCFKSISQIKGEYRGLFSQKHEIYKLDSAGDFVKTEWDGEKKLFFATNNTFSFLYRERGEPCAARASIRYCTGSYRMVKDTVYLTSTHRKSDFYTVTEQRIDSIANGKVMVVACYPNNKLSPQTFINEFELRLNNKRIGEFEMMDTIYCDASEIEEIFISCCSPNIMEWSYRPKNENSNYFKFVLTREIKLENVYIDNYKMVVDNGDLMVLESGYLDVRDNRYSKK
jgi:hypothetical protein